MNEWMLLLSVEQINFFKSCDCNAFHVVCRINTRLIWLQLWPLLTHMYVSFVYVTQTKKTNKLQNSRLEAKRTTDSFSEPNKKNRTSEESLNSHHPLLPSAKITKCTVLRSLTIGSYAFQENLDLDFLFFFPVVELDWLTAAKLIES